MTDITSVLSAVNTALGVIKGLADAPGVNLLPYVSTVSSFVGVAQAALGQGQNIANLVTDLQSTFSGGAPTDAQIAALDARIAAARTKLHAPLPDPEDGEPN